MLMCLLTEEKLRLKTDETTVDLRRPLPTLQHLTTSSWPVQTFKFSGTTVFRDFPQKGPSENAFPETTKEVWSATGTAIQFYSVVGEAGLCFFISGVWSSHQTGQGQTVINSMNSGNIHWCPPSFLWDLFISSIGKRAGNMTSDLSCPGHSLYKLFPSGRKHKSEQNYLPQEQFFSSSLPN